MDGGRNIPPAFSWTPLLLPGKELPTKVQPLSVELPADSMFGAVVVVAVVDEEESLVPLVLESWGSPQAQHFLLSAPFMVLQLPQRQLFPVDETIDPMALVPSHPRNSPE